MPYHAFLVADTRPYTLPCRMVGRTVRHIFSRGYATLHLIVSVSRSVDRSVTFLNSERFSHYCSCPAVRDWIAVYPALLLSRLTLRAHSGGSKCHRSQKEKAYGVAEEMASVRVGIFHVAPMWTFAVQRPLSHRPTKPLIRIPLPRAQLNLALT